MIVSHQHKFVFVAIPKTATHAVRAVLRPQLGRFDWEQCGLFEERSFPIDGLAQIRHGHISCRQLRPFLLPALWQQYVKFCFVRNPYSRFISLCTFLSRDSEQMQHDPIGRMKQLIQDPAFRQRILARPQAEFVCDEHGGLLVDVIGRFETIQRDLDRIIDSLALHKQPLPQRNVSPYRFPLERLDDELVELIQTYYQVDFKLFNYSTQLNLLSD